MTERPADLFGQIDIYLLDQLLRGRIPKDATVFDAGCGGGRNLGYFLRAGHRVAGIDRDPAAIEAVRRLARERTPDEDPARFQVAPLEEHDVPERSADVVVCNAVLHFARDEAQFRAMLDGAWRILRPGGMFFARLASSIGIEDRIRPTGQAERRYHLPDGSQRFLVDEELLLELTASLGGELLDPIKTTNVQNLRCMTTWVLRRTRA